LREAVTHHVLHSLDRALVHRSACLRSDASDWDFECLQDAPNERDVGDVGRQGQKKGHACRQHPLATDSTPTPHEAVMRRHVTSSCDFEIAKSRVAEVAVVGAEEGVEARRGPNVLCA
jgi:hypothetical protein